MDAMSNSTSQSDLSAREKGMEHRIDNGFNVDDVAKKRNRRSPQRYGNVGQLDASDSFEESLISNDDINFNSSEIATSQKVVATVGKKPPAKKLRGDTAEPKTINLDDEFDLLSEPISSTLASSEVVSVNVNDLPIVLSDDNHYIDHKTADSGADLMDVCQRILSQMTDVSARISMIEEIMLKNGSMKNVSKDTKPNLINKIEDNRVFNATNHLPLRNIDDLKAFENNLNNAEFEDIAVIYKSKSILIHIHEFLFESLFD